MRTPRSLAFRPLPHLLVVIGAATALSVACETAETPSPRHHERMAAAPEPGASPTKGLNPVQREMRLLESAMHRSLSLIANGDLAELPPTVFAIHEARAETERSIAAGAYAPPAKGDDIEGFSRRDAAFHDRLVDMVKAAKAGDRPATASAYAKVVEGCVDCHSTYRVGP